MRNTNQRKVTEYRWRVYFLLALLLVALLGLLTRIVDLGAIKKDFLVKQSLARAVRAETIPAHRGKILDRNGSPLAVSVSVDSVSINPKIFNATPEQLQSLATLLGENVSILQGKIATAQNQAKGFIYLKRHVQQDISEQIKNLNVSGVSLEQEYQRYYPEAEVMGQIVGFTNIDDRGQEGIELAYDSWLRGVPGKMQILKDRLGNTIDSLGTLNEAQKGQDLVLSLDRRIQYLAYRELAKIVAQYSAESGSAVVMNANTGEIIAMISIPTCDPNNRETMKPTCYRNRAVTDLFEPGSTAKPFSIASALESGKFTPNTVIDTNPGLLKIENNLVREDEHHNYGVLTVTGVLQKSSNIGVSKITLSLPPRNLLNMLQNVGFGQSSQSGFPGETSGTLPTIFQLHPFALATLSFGYGISMSALQLAHAYTVLASNGVIRPVSFLKLNSGQISGGIVAIPKNIANKIVEMLRTVTELGGTGTRARIHDYSVAGKTGTAYIAGHHGYYKDRYWSLFAGMAPATNPQFVVAVVIKNPRGQYHGGMVAAPAFSNIMEGTLRMYGVPTDANDDDKPANAKNI